MIGPVLILCIVSSMVALKPKISTLINTPKIVPRSENQQKYVNLLNNRNTSILIGLGPAGTGKTFFSCNAAIDGIRNGVYENIVLTRPVVSVEEELGFLPGSFINKMEPWTRPIFDIFLEHFSKVKLDLMIKNGIIEISPLGYMRGRTFKNSFIIADEMQNCSPAQMKMITTRIGEGSKMVITGDLNQSDRCEKNGLVDLVDRIKKSNIPENDRMFELLELSNADIQRSAVVKQILDIYDSKYTISSSIKNKPKPYGENTYVYGDAALIPIQHIKK